MNVAVCLSGPGSKELEDAMQGKVPSLALGGWSLDHSFPEVPAKYLAKHLWTPKLWGKWEFTEGF